MLVNRNPARVFAGSKLLAMSGGFEPSIRRVCSRSLMFRRRAAQRWLTVPQLHLYSLAWFPADLVERTSERWFLAAENHLRTPRHKRLLVHSALGSPVSFKLARKSFTSDMITHHCGRMTIRRSSSRLAGARCRGHGAHHQWLGQPQRAEGNRKRAAPAMSPLS